MTKEQLRNAHNYLFLKYRNQMSIVFEDVPADDFGSYIIARKIVLPNAIKTKQSTWSLFAFLHEIGHILTNTPFQQRCVQEYLATQWALDEAKKIGFEVPTSYIQTYQKYIYRWMNTRSKAEVKKEDLTLSA